MSILASPALRSKSLWSYNPIPNGCVLYLPLWSPHTHGLKFKSIDPFGHTCTRSGSTSPHIRANGHYFNGSDDKETVGSTISIAASISVGFWFNTNQLTTRSTLMQFDELGIEVNDVGGGPNDGSLGCIETGVATQCELIGPISADTWYNFFYIKRGDGATNEIYLGGAIQSLDTDLDWNLDLSGSPGIGSRVAAQYFSGLIGEVWIYNRALSDGEIAHNYNVTKGRYQ